MRGEGKVRMKRREEEEKERNKGRALNELNMKNTETGRRLKGTWRKGKKNMNFKNKKTWKEKERKRKRRNSDYRNEAKRVFV